MVVMVAPQGEQPGLAGGTYLQRSASS
jgi:hypothetical protein